MSAFRREPLGGREPNAARSTGDDGDLSIEFSHSFFSPDVLLDSDRNCLVALIF
jgi:hypothetical protein